jgi:hypothetical protein
LRTPRKGENGGVSDAADALSGGRLVWIEATTREVRIGADGGAVAQCRVSGAGELTTDLERGGPHGGGRRVYELYEGREIVRVSESEGRLTLHLDDGELLHFEAVVNEDGCRIATRTAEAQSLLDRALALVRRA